MTSGRAYRELGEAAWAWVLRQVRDGNGPWLPEVVADDGPPGAPPVDRDSVYAGIGGLPLVLAEISQSQALSEAEQALAAGIAAALAIAGAEQVPRLRHRCLHSILGSGVPERLRPGFWDNDGRCCGTAGVGDILLDAAQDCLEHRQDPPLLPPGTSWMQGAAGIAPSFSAWPGSMRTGWTPPSSTAQANGGPFPRGSVPSTVLIRTSRRRMATSTRRVCRPPDEPAVDRPDLVLG